MNDEIFYNMRNINNLSEKQNSELVELLTGGSQEAFGELYTRYKGSLMRYCKRLLKDEAGSEDVVHDIFLQLWERRDSLNTISSFTGYLHTLAQNRILNIFRKSDVHSRFVRHILMNEKDATNETEDLIIDNDYAELLYKALESLSPRQKEIFQLSRIQGLSYKEISELMQISVDTVQEHASLALKKLRGCLYKHTDIHPLRHEK